jgi:hypothetical protein
VENRRGEQTDIRVEAFPPNGQSSPIDALTVIIEVKGSWHRYLDTAMATQLVGRYLHDTTVQHGIFF